MSYEICQISSYTGTGTISSASNAYDNGSGGGPVTGINYSGSYNIANDTSYATHQSLASTTTYTATTSSISAKQYSGSWANAILYVRYRLVTQGDGNSTQWDSYSEIQYNVGAGWVSINSSVGDNDTGVLTFSLGLGASPTLSSIQVRTMVSGHSKTGSLPDFIASSIGIAYLYDVYVEASYTTNTFTSFTNGGRIVRGNYPSLTVVFTGIAPVVSPGSYSAWVSGVAQNGGSALYAFQQYTATQDSSSTVRTLFQEVQWGSSGSISLGTFANFAGGGVTRGNNMNNVWNRTASTGNQNANTQISMSSYYNGYISAAEWNTLNGL